MINKKKIFIDKSRTFSMASFFFNKEMFTDITSLYFICRTLDDWTDTYKNEKLIEFHNSIENRKSHYILDEYNLLVNRYGISFEPLNLMVDTMLKEQDDLSIISMDDLISYCKGVAGTVGWMISPIIGVKDPKAFDYAISLGIAMQLTNIARDIYEDAKNGRVYIPVDISSKKLTPEIIIDMIIKDYDEIMIYKTKILELAKNYYQMGEKGFKYIPKRERFVIKWAALMYYNIGVNILSRPQFYKNKKATVSTCKRYILLFSVLFNKTIFN